MVGYTVISGDDMITVDLLVHPSACPMLGVEGHIMANCRIQAVRFSCEDTIFMTSFAINASNWSHQHSDVGTTQF